MPSGTSNNKNNLTICQFNNLFIIPKKPVAIIEISAIVLITATVASGNEFSQSLVEVLKNHSEVMGAKIVRAVQDNEVEFPSPFSNYKMVDGIAVAFNSETTSSGDGGQGKSSDGRFGRGTQINDKVEFNQSVDDSFFKKPVN